jgi:hypothetical protein
VKRAIVILAVLGAFAAPAWAQEANDAAVLKFEASGTAIPLGNPFGGDSSLLATFEGKGLLGKISAAEGTLEITMDRK